MLNIFLALAMGVLMSVAAYASTEVPKKADLASPEATTIVNLLKFGRDNKDAYALLTAVRMIAKLPEPKAKEDKKAAEKEKAEKVEVNPSVILDEAVKYAGNNKELLAEIDKTRQSLPNKKACWYEWFCNYYGYCWYKGSCY